MKFACYRCVHCCFFAEERESPVLLWHEVAYLSKLGELMGISLCFKSLGQGLYRLSVTGFCPFYDIRRRACRIHREKPLSCRMFPLLVNLSSLEVSTSLLCPWIYENLKKLSEGLNGKEIEEVFYGEFKALEEVVRWVYTVSRTTPKSAVYFTTYYKELAEEVIKSLSERYKVIRVTESSVVDGFYYVLIDGEVDPEHVDALLRRDEITWYKLEKIPPIS